MNAALARIRELQAELHKQIVARLGPDLILSDRVKAMIAVAVGLLVLLGLFGLNRAVSGLEGRYEKARADMQQLKTQIETNVWQTRSQESQILKSLLQERLWTAPTPGLAEAGYERWLREHMSRYGLEPQQQIQVRRVRVSRQTGTGTGSDPLSDVERMTAKIVMPFDQAGLAGFLADAAEGEKTLVVDRLIVRPGRNPRVEIDISAFYRAPGPARAAS
jgi:hypothetical protein